MNTNDKRKIVMAKEGQKYFFFFDADSEKALLGTFGRYAAHPELNFSWHDAAVLVQRVRSGLSQKDSCADDTGGIPAGRRRSG